MTLEEAYNSWRRLFPGQHKGPKEHVHTGTALLSVHKKGQKFKLPSNFNGQCCGDSHGALVAVVRTDSKGNPTTLYSWREKPDAKVCARERAWRQYISIRDGKNYCKFE